ncbi:MAG: hypothetical protein ACRDPP_00065 [Gaiellaceae bacterium]
MPKYVVTIGFPDTDEQRRIRGWLATDKLTVRAENYADLHATVLPELLGKPPPPGAEGRFNTCWQIIDSKVKRSWLL